MGIVFTVLLSHSINVTLDPGVSPHAVIAVTLEATLSEDGECGDCELRYADGLVDIGAPIVNLVQVTGEPHLPELGEMTVQLCPSSLPSFLRGDCNSDGEVRGVVTDAVFLLNFNFVGGPRPGCLAACDANGDGAVTGVVTDAVYILSYNFLGGPPPPPPFPGCGAGGAADEALGCLLPAASCTGGG
jgi:hypothetical protein